MEGWAPGGPIPSDRLTAWNPGIPGGVPARTSIYTTLNASTYGNGSSDATAGLQAALDACRVGKDVLLSAGDFKITQPLSIDRGVVLRGQGPTLTKLKMPVLALGGELSLGDITPRLYGAVAEDVRGGVIPQWPLGGRGAARV